jgi:hypothetical protein
MMVIIPSNVVLDIFYRDERALIGVLLCSTRSRARLHKPVFTA